MVELVDVRDAEREERVQVVGVLLHGRLQAHDGASILVVLRMAHAQHAPRLAVVVLPLHTRLERQHRLAQPPLVEQALPQRKRVRLLLIWVVLRQPILLRRARALALHLAPRRIQLRLVGAAPVAAAAVALLALPHTHALQHVGQPAGAVALLATKRPRPQRRHIHLLSLHRATPHVLEILLRPRRLLALLPARCAVAAARTHADAHAAAAPARWR
mmetsp:Transcript_82/g.299  ORF Transcript_82/g.299 Transcript_82/m.299 type:complete len:216 (+) Transcript_82:670-1317(+)